MHTYADSTLLRRTLAPTRLGRVSLAPGRLCPESVELKLQLVNPDDGLGRTSLRLLQPYGERLAVTLGLIGPARLDMASTQCLGCPLMGGRQCGLQIADGTLVVLDALAEEGVVLSLLSGTPLCQLPVSVRLLGTVTGGLDPGKHQLGVGDLHGGCA